MYMFALQRKNGVDYTSHVMVMEQWKISVAIRNHKVAELWSGTPTIILKSINKLNQQYARLSVCIPRELIALCQSIELIFSLVPILCLKRYIS